MRKSLALGIITIFFVFIFTSCGNNFTSCSGNNYSYEETKFDAVVVQCEEGSFHPDASYLAMANAYLAQKNYALYSTYVNLANTNGTYDYNITISIDGDNYTVIREESYEVGQYITITKLDTYQNSQLIKTEYK